MLIMLTSNQIKTYIAFGDRFAKRVQKLRKYRPRRMGVLSLDWSDNISSSRLQNGYLKFCYSAKIISQIM
jgi:hypothetical protein